ncbi:MAG: hypothetical protein E7170_03265 [Firmicutes bacterium]|nr:hypothetical protein [Bacillota bacterium]
MKNKKFLLLSFIVPLTIFLFFFYINGLLTDKMILIGDSEIQYYPLFHYLKGIFDGTNSLFYSFSKGVGGTMFGTFFYYISSPLNSIVHFIEDKYILDFMTYLTIFKLSLCGLTMYIYMSKKFKTNSYMILIFSLLYSLSGYNLNYFLNIMWLDVIALTPIVLLGIDRIIDNKSPLLYIITLTISIYSNYYISYMLCIFCVLYFIYEILLKYDFKTNKKEIFNTFKKFIISSLLSGLMCSFFLIPCIIEMTDYGRHSSLNEILKFNFNIFNLIANSYLGSVDTTHPFNTYSINLYCGIIIFPLIYLYFKNKDISKKEKILSGILIIFMILPCFIEPLNYIWHLFTIPIGYNYRYSFLLILFLLIISFKSYTNYSINKISILEFLSIYISYSVIIIFIMYFKDYYPHINYVKVWLSNLFLITYFIILYKIKNKKTLNKIVFCFILLECLINVGIVLNNNDFKNRDLLEYKYDYIEKYNTNKRITTRLFPNASLITNHLDTNIFLSTRNKSIYTLYRLDYNSNPRDDINLFLLGNNVTYISNSLLAKHIIISEEKNSMYKTLENINIDNTNYVVQENMNALNLGYIINNNCNNLEISFPYDEKAFNCLTNENNNFYKEIGFTKNNNTIHYKTDKDYYYIYMPNINDNSKYFFNIFNKDILTIQDDYILIRNSNINKQLKLTIENENIDNLKLYYFDYELFDKKIQILKNTEFNYTIKKDKMTAQINSDGGLLMLTIPYEKGIQIKLDDKSIEYEQVLDNFIGFKIEKGIHEIEISYQHPGLILGFIISILSTSFTIIYIKKRY